MQTINFVNNNHTTLDIIRPQVNALQQAAIETGFKFTQTNRLNNNSINVLIEGFEHPSVIETANYVRNTGDKICLILTEHIELKNFEVRWNTESLRDTSEYMPQKHYRFKQLLNLLPAIKTFITVGHLPALAELDRIFPTIPVCRVPLTAPSISSKKFHGNLQKAIFFGKVTNFRRRFLKQIAASFDLHIIDNYLPPEELSGFVKKRQIGTSISIPQYEDWKWESPIRTLIALELSLLPINIWPNKNHFTSLFASDFELSDFENPEIVTDEVLKECRDRCFDVYNAGRRSGQLDGWQQKFQKCLIA